MEHSWGLLWLVGWGGLMAGVIIKSVRSIRRQWTEKYSERNYVKNWKPDSVIMDSRIKGRRIR